MMNEVKNDDSDLADLLYVDCIGADNKQHVCEPHKDVCKCGMEVKRKKILRDDWKLFSCYECTY